MIDIVYVGYIGGAVILTGVGYVLKDTMVKLMLDKLNEAKEWIEANQDIAPEFQPQLESVKAFIAEVDKAFADGRVTTSEVLSMAKSAVGAYKSFKVLYEKAMKG